jgi:hypothetical protein
MTSDPILDLQDFPMVGFDPTAQPAGYGPRWAAEMDRLLARGLPFVLIVTGSGPEAHTDRATRSRWLRANKQQLAAHCRGILLIEPDAGLRAERQRPAEAAGKAFGVAMGVVESLTAAQRLAEERLAAEA